MKRFAVAFLVIGIFFSGAAFAQFGAGPPAANAQTMVGPYPQAIGGPVGSPTYVTPPSPGIIDIGQALGPAAQPYVDAVVNALILAGVGYLGNLLRNKFNVSLDEGARNALVTALQNQAGSMIADGFVKVEQNGKVTIHNDQALINAANEVMQVVPDAAKRLGFTPDYVAKRIIDTIPQTAAGAAAIAAAAPAPVVNVNAIPAPPPAA